MKDKPISPVVVTFKALPGVRVYPMGGNIGVACQCCALRDINCGGHAPNGHKCWQRDYIWREVPPKVQAYQECGAIHDSGQNTMCNR